MDGSISPLSCVLEKYYARQKWRARETKTNTLAYMSGASAMKHKIFFYNGAACF
jgi:hypothetical protein